MPRGYSNSNSNSSSSSSSYNNNSNSVSVMSSSKLTKDEQYYMDRMREILVGFPNTGPPTYPVQLLDHLFMGNQRNADNIELLKRYGITHVLNCAGLRRFDFTRSPYPKESGIKGFLMISAEDTEDFEISRYFDEAISFLNKVKKAKGKAFVHCNLGVNRSGAIVAAYLMVEKNCTLLEVINYVKLKRFVVLSNKGFRRQLIEFAKARGLLDPIIQCSVERNNYRSTSPSSSTAYSSSLTHVEDSRLNRNRTPTVEQECVTSDVGINNVSSSKKDFISGESLFHERTKAKNADSTDAKRITSEGISIKERMLTLPRYPAAATTASSKINVSQESDLLDHLRVEVIVSEHKEPVELIDEKLRSKPPLQPLMPVYETKSCEVSSNNSSSTAGGGGAGGVARQTVAAAESMSAKLSGFLTLLGPKKPFRSTSYSNVSSSQSMPSSMEDQETSSTSSSASLSTTRPLRIYTRSCTDSELYRSKQGGPSTAGQFGLSRSRPHTKP